LKPWQQEIAMVQLKADAAYVRKSAAGRPPHLSTNASPEAFDARVYELLKTPHTVTSLRRALGDSTDVSSDDPAIQEAMRRLLVRDLIELSPDS
jgi:hypothetical protein